MDPSTRSIVEGQPQTWNRYVYTNNNPLNFTDKTGRYPTGIHNKIIDRAFPGLSNEQRAILKNASKMVDKDQSVEGSFKHGMRAPGQTVLDAARKADSFVGAFEGAASKQQESFEAQGGEGLSNDALQSFGTALHTVTDSESPAHDGFQVWNGTEGAGNKAAAVSHLLAEANPSEENLGQATRSAQEAFKRTFGSEAATAATKPPDDDDLKKN